MPVRLSGDCQYQYVDNGVGLMHWTIPEPYSVPPVKPMRWSGGWRGFSLCAMAAVLVGSGGYFWLKDPRLLLYTFGGVVVLMLLFAGMAVLSLLPELQRLVAAGVSVEVALPEGCDTDEWQQFTGAWQTLGLSASRLLPSLTALSSYAKQMTDWLASSSPAARLVIVHHREARQTTTEGTVVWLLAPSDGRGTGLPVRCALHRPMRAALPVEPAALRRFLDYQPLTTEMNGLWTDAITREQADALLVAHSQRPQTGEPGSDTNKKETAVTPPLPEQHYLPHWLGKTGPCHDWFAVTLMMQMALAKPGVQCAMIHDGEAGLLSSVSTGALTDD